MYYPLECVYALYIYRSGPRHKHPAVTKKPNAIGQLDRIEKKGKTPRNKNCENFFFNEKIKQKKRRQKKKRKQIVQEGVMQSLSRMMCNGQRATMTVLPSLAAVSKGINSL